MLFGLQTGMSFSISILKEMQLLNPGLLKNSLEHMYNSLSEMKPGQLYNLDKIAFMTDAAIAEARDFIESVAIRTA
jgi:hypothetical protein